MLERVTKNDISTYCMKQCLRLFKYMFDARLSSDANPITLDQAIYQNSGQRIVDCCYSPSDGYILYQRTFASEPVDILVHETRNGFFIKPANRHFKFQFEQFFGFGAGNIGYDKDRTVFVPKH